MEEKQILINALKVNYKIAGKGPALLILHGWGGSSDSWLEVQRLLAKGGYRVVVPDLSGFGKTITPPEPWGIKEYVDFVLNFTEKIGLKDFFLLGHSFGGRISIEISCLYPEKIKKLILCNSAGIKPKPGLRTTLLFFAARMGNALLSPKRLSRFKDSARNLFYFFLRKQDYAKATNRIMRETIKKVLNEDLLPKLAGIKTKTLIVWGEADRMVPLKYAHMFREKIADSELKIMPKIGHSPHLEDPAGLSQIILKFLDQE